MGWFDRLFGGGSPQSPPPPPAEPSRQLPSSQVAKEFGEVNVRPAGGRLEVSFTILMEPQGADAEGWQTGVALDASSSMMEAYGRGLVNGPKGGPPDWLRDDYIKKGWVTIAEADGAKSLFWSPRAFEDAIGKGYLRSTDNVVQPVARKMIEYLAGQLDADGGTTLIYWACGQDGSATEVAGDVTAEECETLEIGGPKQKDFGDGTKLLPAMKYFVDRFVDAERGMYVFLTDGRLDDLDDVKRYTTRLAKDIQGKRRKPVKCVLIGIGDGIDEAQMEELDDLDTGTEVDIWDHKIAREMRSLVEIFAEVVDENRIVAPTARIFDDSGSVVATFADGLPAKVSFDMPRSSAWFELEAGETRVRQPVK